MEGIGLKAKEIAELVGGWIEGDEEFIPKRIAESDAAGPEDMTVWDGRSPIAKDVGMVIAPIKPPVRFKVFVEVKDYRQALARLLNEFEPDHPFKGISPAAFIEDGAEIHPEANIGPFAYVSSGAIVERNVVLYPFVYVGPRTRIGEGSILYPFVYVGWGVEIGRRCLIHPGAVIGSEGFGFVPTSSGWLRIPQVGRVKLEDQVRLGANTAVDRATFSETVVGEGSKIDNLVQVGHNVRIGPYTVIAAQTGIAGGAKIGSWVVFGGQVGVADHVEVGDGSIAAAGSGIASNVPPKSVLAGKIPARDRVKFNRSAALFFKLPEIYRRLLEIAKKMEKNE
ncbi:MAG: UDP-3-O-(3-hydroxymyristoyl)glucosamine N-acyltransferase [Thermotogae bacterium]|nr:UDP-3-O-(3-hydroxymyristoyl)glucosamine N-acyltransferase [Thermotogota bacterium]